MICVALPMPPSVNHLYANRKGGRGRFTSKYYAEWQREASIVLSMQRPGSILGDVAVEYKFGPRIPNADLANREKALSDLLVKCHVIPSDSNIVHMTLAWDDSVKGCVAIVRGVPTREAKRVAA